jgi:hypothetical protein
MFYTLFILSILLAHGSERDSFKAYSRHQCLWNRKRFLHERKLLALYARQRLSITKKLTFWAKGLNANDTDKEIFAVYGGKCLSRKAVHNWV